MLKASHTGRRNAEDSRTFTFRLEQQWRGWIWIWLANPIFCMGKVMIWVPSGIQSEMKLTVLQFRVHRFRLNIVVLPRDIAPVQ